MLSILLTLSAAAILFRARKGLMLLPVLLLFLWTWPPAAMLFSRTLEWRYADRAFPNGDAQAIVVLGGSAYGASPQPEAVPGAATYIRCRYAAWLYKNWKPLPVVVSGGPAGPLDSLAGVMRSILIAEGVPAGRIRLERESRSTFENAAFTAAQLLPEGVRVIALVTDARHMLRAEGCFRKRGFSVVPAPCAFRSLRLDDTLLPSARALQHNDEALHEWIGLAAYRLAGKL